MKKIKKLISKIMTTTMMVNILPINCFALGYNDTPTTLTTYVGNTGLGNSNIVSGITIAPFTLDGNVAYCMNALKDFPVMHNYTASGSYDSDSFLRAIAYYGYGSNRTNLKEKHSVTDEEARAYTQFAIWDYIEKGYFASKSYPYLDELRSLAKNTGVPAIQFNISNDAPTITDSGATQVSEVITTSSNYTGTFTFPSDGTVYSVDLNGTPKNTFNIGESFKIIGTDTVTGSVTKDITVNIEDVTLLKFIPNDPRYQDLGVPSTKLTSMNRQMTLNFKNAISYSSVDILKTDDSLNPLQGVEFSIYSDSSTNTLIEKKTTGVDGRLTFSNLEVGKTYYIKETSALTGYVMDSSIKNVTVQAQPKELSFVNTKITGQIKIIKTEEGRADIKLKDAEFQILDDSDQIIDTIVTNKDGEATSKILPYGKYKIKESKAPIGYNLSDKIVEIDVSEHNRIYEVSYGNEFVKGSIEIIKKDADDGKFLSGVKFGIYNANDNSLIEEIITNNNGVAKSSDLRYGDYFIKELEASKGYALDESTYNITISENLKTYPKEILNSKISGALALIKLDSEDNTALADVEFLIECIEGFDLGNSWTISTNKDGEAVLDKLNFGKYTIKEIKAKEGYVVGKETVDFEIANNGEIVDIEVFNDKIYGTLDFEKVDKDTGENVAGAIIRVEGINEFNKNINFEFESTKDNNLFSLPYGQYNIYEVSAPAGYVLDSTVHSFKVSVNQESVNVIIENEKIKGTLVINKLSTEDNKPLEGAVFGLYDSNNKLIKEVTTDSDGIATFYDIPCGKYYFNERKAPTGYLVDLSIYEFEIKEAGDLIEKTIYNKPLKPYPDSIEEELIPLPDTGGLKYVGILASLIMLAGSCIVLGRRK